MGVVKGSSLAHGTVVMVSHVRSWHGEVDKLCRLPGGDRLVWLAGGSHVWLARSRSQGCGWLMWCEDLRRDGQAGSRCRMG